VNRKLSCRDIVELVTDYIEDALPAEERRRFEHHLTYCPGCVTYVAQIRETIRVTGQLPREEPLAPALRERLLSQFRSWKRGD
jgi:anti-sigma factor RsiW